MSLFVCHLNRNVRIYAAVPQNYPMSYAPEENKKRNISVMMSMAVMNCHRGNYCRQYSLFLEVRMQKLECQKHTRLVQCSAGVTHGLFTEQSTVIIKIEMMMLAVLMANVVHKTFLWLRRGVKRE